ncbi:MAG TPA: hypothetical protein VNA19_04055, partial [Pyrinomonadaceae bacterium]|nr:hypothetical protein [Pyrinomonadaceae bacterium]
WKNLNSLPTFLAVIRFRKNLRPEMRPTGDPLDAALCGNVATKCKTQGVRAGVEKRRRHLSASALSRSRPSSYSLRRFESVM